MCTSKTVNELSSCVSLFYPCIIKLRHCFEENFFCISSNCVFFFLSGFGVLLSGFFDAKPCGSWIMYISHILFCFMQILNGKTLLLFSTNQKRTCKNDFYSSISSACHFFSFLFFFLFFVPLSSIQLFGLIYRSFFFCYFSSVALFFLSFYRSAKFGNFFSFFLFVAVLMCLVAPTCKMLMEYLMWKVKHSSKHENELKKRKKGFTIWFLFPQLNWHLLEFDL